MFSISCDKGFRLLRNTQSIYGFINIQLPGMVKSKSCIGTSARDALMKDILRMLSELKRTCSLSANGSQATK